MPRRAASPGAAADLEDAPVEPTLAAGHARWPEETAAFARGFDRDALRVVSWNLQLLPGAFAGQGGCPASLERRAKRIVDNVLALARATRVDVVAFQEVWHEGAARVLRAGLRALFPHQHSPAAYCGLLTVTCADLPHVHTRFVPFRNTASVEGWWFTKGVAAVVVEAGEEETRNTRACPFAVLNTHTQSDFWASGAATRAAQMLEMRALLDKIERWPRPDSRGGAHEMTKLLVGDLNVAAGSDEYRAAMRALGDPTDILTVTPDAGADETYTFPIGTYESTVLESLLPRLCLTGGKTTFGAYVAKTPTEQLDHALRFPGADRRRAEGTPSAAIVLAGLARGEDGAPLSDHAPVFAVAQR